MIRTLFTKLTAVLLMVLVLSGCKTTAPQPITPKSAAPPASTQIIVTEGAATYEQIEAAVKGLSKGASAQEIADMLTDIGSMKVPDADRSRVAQLEIKLLSRLRVKVKSEVMALHQTALKSSSYSNGYTKAREAASILALYPLSEDMETLKDAEYLSMRQNQVLNRLELIRRQRYNHWAAGQAEQALRQLRENGKDGTEKAIEYLREIEPGLLESSVSSIYSYTVTEIMDKFKKDEKAGVAKKLTDPSVPRRNLEGF